LQSAAITAQQNLDQKAVNDAAKNANQPNTHPGMPSEAEFDKMLQGLFGGAMPGLNGKEDGDLPIPDIS